MLTAYHFANKRLEVLPAGAALEHAEWIDLFRATPRGRSGGAGLGH